MMDEIDRELKQIQLQRERLALKRDLARSEWKANTIGIAGQGLLRAMAAVRAVAEGIGATFKRWWKLAALVTVLGAMVVGGLVWKEGTERAKLVAAEEKYRAELYEFMALKCGDEVFLKWQCETEASRAFAKLKDAGNTTGAIVSDATAVAEPAEAAMPVAATDKYVVQVGQFADAGVAREVRQKVESRGFKAYTTVAAASSGNRFRVRVGPFASRDDADKTAGKIRSGGVPVVVLSL